VPASPLPLPCAPLGGRPSGRGGHGDRTGLTLIELLIVLVVIGALAAVAMPRFWDTRRRAQVASIKWELRNAVPRAEAHYMENSSYAGLALQPKTPGVTLDLVESGPLGYRLRGTHQGAPGAVCELLGGALADGGGGGTAGSSASSSNFSNFGPACK
jgi:type IV pilus assembly protein PilA